MYSLLLTIHSFVRWLLLVSLVIATVYGYWGWLRAKPFKSTHHLLRNMVTVIALIQLTLGVWLYLISPVTDYFIHHYTVAVHQREIRFFGMEHSSMMVLSIAFTLITSRKINSRPTDAMKFRTMAIWYSIVLVIIFLSIPWSFSPFTSRPLFRAY